MGKREACEVKRKAKDSTSGERGGEGERRGREKKGRRKHRESK